MAWMTVLVVDSNGRPYNYESVTVTSFNPLLGSAHEEKHTDISGQAEFELPDEKIIVYVKGQTVYTGYPTARIKAVI